jgi:hypothetical protein
MRRWLSGVKVSTGSKPLRPPRLSKKIVAAAVHLQIELAADGEHGVADGLGFESAGGEAPEVADVGIDLNRR